MKKRKSKKAGSKHGSSGVSDASNQSVRKVFLDVSREPTSLYAKLVMQNPNAKFIKQYRDEQGKFHVITKVPSKHGERVRVNWVFDPQGAAMRKRAIERQSGRPSSKHLRFPREAVKRFPRLAIRRFPRLAKKG